MMGTSAAIRLDTNGMHSTWKATAAVGIAVCLGVVSCGGIRVTASFGAEPSSESPIGVTAPSPELVKAQAERLKAETDSRKASDARLQFFLDWGYRVGLSAAALVLLVWLIPQVAEITLPWGGGTLSVKRAPKERLPEEAYAPPLPAPVLTEATEILKKTLMPGPTTDRMVDRLEEAEVYQRAGGEAGRDLCMPPREEGRAQGILSRPHLPRCRIAGDPRQGRESRVPTAPDISGVGADPNQSH